MIAYFRACGTLRFPTKWGTGLLVGPGWHWAIVPRPPRASATRQAGRGFWRMVMLKQKCRLDERSVIRQTANSVRCVAFGRIALGHPGRCASGGPRPAAGSIFHRAILRYGLTAAHAGMTCALDEMVNGLKILSWLNSDGDKA